MTTPAGRCAFQTHFDIIVVGAGIVGLAHAYIAARRGLRVCVVEREAVNLGASIRNFGFVTVTGQGAGDTWRRARRARDIWEEVAAHAGISVLHRGLWLSARRNASVDVLEEFLATAMGEHCQLLSATQARRHTSALALDGVKAVLHSPHELRIEARTAIARLTLWLEQTLHVTFRFSETVQEIATPRVLTSRGTLSATRVVACPGTDFNNLFAERLQRYQLSLCQLQMLRIRADAALRLPGAVMTELSLVRYRGYAQLPSTGKLLAQLRNEDAETIDQGVHLIAVQSADGSLVVGDSHRYSKAPGPFAEERIDALILKHFDTAIQTKAMQVSERWLGVYPFSADSDCVIDSPDDATRAVLVTSGTGMSTAFGIAEDVFSDW